MHTSTMPPDIPIPGFGHLAYHFNGWSVDRKSSSHHASKIRPPTQSPKIKESISVFCWYPYETYTCRKFTC